MRIKIKYECLFFQCQMHLFCTKIYLYSLINQPKPFPGIFADGCDGLLCLKHCTLNHKIEQLKRKTSTQRSVASSLMFHGILLSKIHKTLNIFGYFFSVEGKENTQYRGVKSRGTDREETRRKKRGSNWFHTAPSTKRQLSHKSLFPSKHRHEFLETTKQKNRPRKPGSCLETGRKHDDRVTDGMTRNSGCRHHFFFIIKHLPIWISLTFELIV